jgi:hypothetical protein
VEWLRAAAEQRLRQLDAMDQLDALRRMAGDYEKRTGTPLRSWEQLIRAGALRGIPVDPAGNPYRLDAERKVLTLDPRSPLNPLPEEPLSIGPVPGAR